jgi:hypothetical protein
MPGLTYRFLASKSFFTIIVVPILLAPFASAQQDGQILRRPDLTYAERIALSRPLLVHAESTAAGLGTGSRALLLYRLGGAWYPLDRGHAIQLYRQAFDVATESDIRFRGLLERAIVIDLIPISPSDALDLIARGEPAESGSNPDSQRTTRNAFYGMLIRFALARSDIALATRAFNNSLKAGALNEGATAKLMASLPTGARAERERIFSAAVDFYQHDPDPSMACGSPGLSDLIARTYAQVPSQLVLLAIEQELNQAEKVGRSGSCSSSLGEGALFHSIYDFKLFAIVPALRSLDPKRAEALLAQHEIVADALKRLPQGIISIEEKLRAKGISSSDPIYMNQDWIPEGFLLFNGEGPAPKLDALDMGLEFTLPAKSSLPDVAGEGEFYPNADTPESKILGRTVPCPADVLGILKEAEGVAILQRVATTCGGGGCSYKNTFPRAKLIQAVAERCTYGGDGVRAHEALEAQLEILPQVPEEDRVKFLADAADLYLRLGDRDRAAQVVRLGLAAAHVVLDENAKTYHGQDQVAEALWPAAESYRRMLALGVNSDLSATQAAVDAIPDSVMAEFERVILARALLGVPVRMSMIGGPHGGYGRVETATAFTRF